MNGNRIDWFKVILHFVCGAVLGAFVGLGFWAYWSDGDSMRVGVFLIAGGAIVVGLFAGLFLDRFWEGLKEHGHWLWPWPW